MGLQTVYQKNRVAVHDFLRSRTDSFTLQEMTDSIEARIGGSLGRVDPHFTVRDYLDFMVEIQTLKKQGPIYYSN